MKSAFTEAQILEAQTYSKAIARYTNLLGKKSDLQTEDNYKVLRKKRNFYWRENALHTYFKSLSTELVAKQWSMQTIEIVKEAWQFADCDKHGLILLAMGKLGALELNLSSDIDLIVLSNVLPNKESQKSINLFRSLLNDITEDGFCYRVDLDLRPGGKAAPTIISIKQFEDYLWTQSELWERLAFVRMSIICATESQKHEANDLIQRFVYRKFLDFQIIQEFKNLRKRIHHEYESSSTPKKWNLKHSPGGIRDIELLIHSLQVMHGGRIPALRTSSTTHAVSVIAKNNVFNPKDCETVLQSYWQLRDLEHWMQMKDDLQTYEWNNSFGCTELINVAAITAYTQLNANLKIIEEVLGSLETPDFRTSDNIEEKLKQLGFTNFDHIDFLNKWSEIKSTDRNPSKDKTRRDQILTVFVDSLSQLSQKSSLALYNMHDFMIKGRSHGGLLDLLSMHPPLIKDLSVLFCFSPYLGKIIVDRPELLDSFLYRKIEANQNDEQEFLEKLFERRLLNEILAGIDFVKSGNLASLFSSQTTSADEICSDLLNLLYANHKIGTDERIEVLTLGKWGAYELGFKSDLDFIFVKSTQPTEADYKIARRFFSRISEPHRGGAIYEIDLRLRPTGKAGPLIVSYEQLLDYFENKADAWERQSYLLSRIVGHDNHLLVSQLREAIINRGFNADDIQSLNEIRSKLLKIPVLESLDIKLSKGGLTDIELFLQTQEILGKFKVNRSGALNLITQLSEVKKQTYKKLLDNYFYLKKIEQHLRLLSGYKITQIIESNTVYAQLCSHLNNDNLLPNVLEILQTNSDLMMQLDPQRNSI